MATTVQAASFPAARAAEGSFRLPSLDGLRACALVLVLFCHSWFQLGIHVGKFGEILVYRTGQAGVELFFALSGFLITYLLRREYERYGRIALDRFYLRRALRILPPVGVYLVAVALLAHAGALQVSDRLFTSAATFFVDYVHRPDAPDDTRCLAHLWSLSIEEQFYLIWPFLVSVFGPARCRKWTLGLIALAPLVRVACYFLFPTHRGMPNHYFHLEFDVFLFGCLLALLYGSEWVERLVWPIRSEAGLLGLCVAALLLEPMAEGRLSGLIVLPLAYTVKAVLPALVLAWVFIRPDSVVCRWLNFPPVRTLGIASYSIYLWQNMFTMRAEGNILVSIGAAVTVGFASYFVTELPFISLRKHFGR